MKSWFRMNTQKQQDTTSHTKAIDLDAHTIKGVPGVNIDGEMYKGDNAFAQAKFHKFLLIAIFIVTLFNYQTASSLRDTERTIMVPLTGKPMTVGSDRVDNAFLVNMLTFINANYVSATPASARVQSALLLPFIHPTQYANMQKRLDLRANKLQTLSSTSLYASIDWGRAFKVSEERDRQYQGIQTKLWKVEFHTTRLLFVTGKQPEIDNIKVELYYTVENGRFWIVDIIEVF